MRIGIDATALPPRLAGASRYLINLVNHLALIDSDNEYFVFVKRRDADRFLFLAENFHAVLLEDYARPARLLWQTFRPASYARRLHLDLWHAPHYVAPRDLGNCRLVVTFHDLTFMLFPQFYDVSKRLPFQHFIRDAVTRADAIISVSNTTRRDLLRCFPQLGCRSVTIHSGVEERFFQPKGQDGLGELHASVPSGYPFILYVGTLERRKNVPMLVEAFAELIRSTDVPHHLVLVGQPENDLVSVRKAITRNGVTQRVHLAGHVSEADLERLYAGADLFVCPSHYEGFAFPVLEAMASGVPALCSYAGASAEVARHRERFFPPDDPAALARLMQRALSDSTFRRQLVELGRQRAAEFCWQKTAAATRSVYEEVVSNSRSVTRSPAPVSASSDLETALLRTLIYSDLFDYPLTLEELHRGLIGHRAGMTEVQRALSSRALSRRVAFQDGFYFLRGREHLPELRRRRQAKSRATLLRHRRYLQLVCNFPFVRAVALSGALAFENANGKDDIDLFLLVDGRRTWTTYLSLAVLMKVLGKRRTMCFNYVDGRDELTIPERNFYVAHQIAYLRPLSGNGSFDRFWRANRWVREYLPQAHAPETLTITCAPNQSPRLRRLAEKFLGGPLFDWLEDKVYRAYGGRVRQLTRHLGRGVEVSRRRIQLYTNDHFPRIRDEFHRRTQFTEATEQQGIDP